MTSHPATWKQIWIKLTNLDSDGNRPVLFCLCFFNSYFLCMTKIPYPLSLRRVIMLSLIVDVLMTSESSVVLAKSVRDRLRNENLEKAPWSGESSPPPPKFCGVDLENGQAVYGKSGSVMDSEIFLLFLCVPWWVSALWAGRICEIIQPLIFQGRIVHRHGYRWCEDFWVLAHDFT